MDGSTAPRDVISRAEIGEQLERILASSAFRRSARLQRFLRLTVERAAEGRIDDLKEYALGRDVFDRGPDYDPRLDSIVRVEAQRLRKKLAAYYGTTGSQDPIVLRYPSGFYVPEFARATAFSAVSRGPSAADAADAARAATTEDALTIAVLPFSNLTREDEQQYFCDGITEDIINALTSISELRVIGRASAFALDAGSQDPREIGARVGAATIVEGSVRKAGEVLRVSVKIIDCRTCHVSWSEVFDRKVQEIFTIEDEIARSVAGTLRITLGTGWRPDGRLAVPNTEAHILYLKGRQAWNQMTLAGLDLAIETFGRATSLYPDYPLPYGGLADTFLWLAVWGVRRPLDALPESRRAVTEALRLDPEFWDAQLSLGALRCLLDYDWDQGLETIEAAVALHPNSEVGQQKYGTCLLLMGRFEESFQVLGNAVRLDPLSIRTNRTLGMAYYIAGDYEQAERWLRTSIALHPGSPESHCLLARVCLAQGRNQEALAEARTCEPRALSALSTGILGICLARNGDVAGARSLLEDLRAEAARTYVDATAHAYVHVALGEAGEALACLSQAIKEHSLFGALCIADPIFAELRTHPNFPSVAAALKLPHVGRLNSGAPS